MTKPNDNTLSNYPGGFNGGVSIRNVPILNSFSGQVFWVNSNGGSDINAGTYTRPRATIAGALLLCKADRGDIIMVKSGHAETITAAAQITMNITGVAVIGMGQGTDRPELTFSTSTGASVLITASNTTFQNIVGITGINALTQPFDVRASDCLLDIEWQDPTTILEAARAILTTAAADRLQVKLKYKGQTGGSSCVNAIRLVGVDGGRITVDFNGKASTSVIEFLTTACTDIVVDGYMYNASITTGAKDIVDTATGSTWYAAVYDGSAGQFFSGGSAQAFASDDITSVVNLQEKTAVSAAAVMVNGNTIFTIAGGPIEIMALVGVCVTGNDVTASTLQYSVTPTVGSAQTISAASASLASALAGASVTLAGTALATAALLNANGPNLIANPGTIFCPAGQIKMVIGTGSTTGTWRFYIRYKPLTTGVTVS